MPINLSIEYPKLLQECMELRQEIRVLKAIKPKIIIEVRGGLVQETISTTKDLEIYIADYDSLDEGDLFTHWNCEADKIVNDEEFKKLADKMDLDFKISRK